jgi:hypothetical protein
LTFTSRASPHYAEALGMDHRTTAVTNGPPRKTELRD